MELIETFIYFIFYTYLSGHPNFKIMGKSMAPTYNQGAYVLTDKYKATPSLENGSVVVFQYPSKPDTVMVNRIIAGPGDKFSIKNGVVYLNGTKLEESYTNGSQTEAGKFVKEDEELTIPENKYLVMGDNRPYSLDSRSFGLISEESVVGIVTKCYWNCR
jgi:signal peptidase I